MMTDSSKLPSKYANLQRANALGLTTPQTLLISSSFNENTNQSELDNFTQASGAKRFIVRSMNICEDGSEHSLAGHFWSSDAISADEVISTIKLAKENNQQVLDTLKLDATPQLMLQEFIEHSIGGVLFAPWSFFSDYYYVEYSTESVQQVVAGNAEPAVLSLQNEQMHPLKLPDSLDFLSELLSKTIKTLLQKFDFALDCEWVYSPEKEAIVVLQIRPQTHLVGAIQAATPELVTQLNLNTSWQFSALSESLGSISPLSFSLLEQLYKDSLGMFQSLGYKAKQVNFMRHLPDGTVLINSENEKRFYQPSLIGGFWKGFRAPQWLKNINDYLSVVFAHPPLSTEFDKPFSYKTLSRLFELWMAANLMSDGGGRDSITLPHAYELSWHQKIEAPTIKPNKSDWETLNSQLRDLFFFELNKLTLEIKANKQRVFCTWQEYLNNDFSKAAARQQHDAHYAIYDFSTINESASDTDKIQSIGAKKIAKGKLFIIENPARFHQNIPVGSIVLSPYFDNRWAHQIQNLAGIITHKGSQLSHAAIVAREHNIPFYVVSEDMTKELTEGVKITLDAIQLLIDKSPP